MIPGRSALAAQEADAQPDSAMVGWEANGDTHELDHSRETEWLRVSRWRSSLSWQSDPPGTAIGNAVGFQTRLRITVEPDWSFGLVLDKDIGEPFGWHGSAPWTGPELKRFHLARKADHWQMVLGNLRIQHGFGLIAGRRIRPYASLSSPLWQPGGDATVREYAGTSGAPVRRGVALALTGSRGHIAVWNASSRPAISIRTREHSPDRGEPVVVNASGTTAFQTASSIGRRKGLRLASTGLMLGVGPAHRKVAGMVEHQLVHIEARDGGELLKTILPSSSLIGSLTSHLSWKRIRLVGEMGRIGGFNHIRWSIRWKRAGGSGLLIGRIRHPDAGRSPFGSDQRFLATNQQESFWTTGIYLKRKHHRFSFSGQRHAYDSWGDVLTDDTLPAQRDLGARLSSRYLYSGAYGRTLMVSATADRDIETHQPALAAPPIQGNTSQIRLGADLAVPFGEQNRWVFTAQLQAGTRKVSNNRSASSGLIAVDLERLGRSVSWNGLLLIRGSKPRSPVLYARMPVPAGFFPVLAGSSPRAEWVNRVVWQPGPNMQLETWMRAGRGLSGDPGTLPVHALRLLFQLTIGL